MMTVLVVVTGEAVGSGWSVWYSFDAPTLSLFRPSPYVHTPPKALDWIIDGLDWVGVWNKPRLALINLMVWKAGQMLIFQIIMSLVCRGPF